MAFPQVGESLNTKSCMVMTDGAHWTLALLCSVLLSQLKLEAYEREGKTLDLVVLYIHAFGLWYFNCIFF